MSQPRVCLVSLRGVNPHAAWCSNYEFEDVIAAVDDVDTFTLQPGAGYSIREWVAGRVIWRPGLRRLTPHLNPGLKPIRLQKDYDLFVFVCMNPNDLIYLSAVEGWKERCRKKICIMVEFYTGWLQEYAFHLDLLRDFDHVAQSFSSSVAGVQQAIDRPCYHLPLGADVVRFTPYPNAPSRSVDVYSIGRRPDSLHAALLERAVRKEIFYLYDTLPGGLIRPRDPRQHRQLFAQCAQRARFFVAYPAKVDQPDETRGQSEVGARFFEGAAAGAVLIGRPPTTPAFARDFDWPNAVVDLGAHEEQLEPALKRFTRDPERLAALSRRNAVTAMRRFDWGYRWQETLRIAGLRPSARLNDRLTTLNELADTVESLPLMHQPAEDIRAPRDIEMIAVS